MSTLLEQIESLLQSYAETLADNEATRAEMNGQIESATPPEVRAAIASIKEEFEMILVNDDNALSELQAQIKRLTIEHAKSVKAHGYHAVYSAGRVTWDSKALDGYALAHPEIVAMRKTGEASVSIRKAQGE